MKTALAILGTLFLVLLFLGNGYALYYQHQQITELNSEVQTLQKDQAVLRNEVYVLDLEVHRSLRRGKSAIQAVNLIIDFLNKAVVPANTPSESPNSYTRSRGQ